jgi:hypothetical protein
VARSLLEQLTQIRRSRTYDDAVSDVYNSAVAEPTVSGSLQEDLNVIRTLMKSVKGSSYWYSDLGGYFDPTDTTAGNAENKDLNLTNIKNNTLDSKTVIVAVSEDNSGSNYTVSGTSTGFLMTSTAQYALPTNRTGLPVFNSVTNSGTYYDEGGADNVCRIDVIDADTDAEIQDGSGNIIYAKFHDAADNGGTGTGTDVYVRFYANDAVCDLSTATPTPTSVKIVYPRRKLMSNMAEYEWMRTDFVNSWEGDVELMEDVSNLWSFTGASDGDTEAGPFTNESGNYILTSGPNDLESAIDLLNTEVGDRTYTTATYLTDGEDITDSLDALSEAVIANDGDISTNASNIASNASDISTLQSSMSTAETDITNLEAAVGSDTGTAGLDYSSNNYVSDTDSLEVAIGKLDAAISSSSAAKYIETTSGDITKNVEHSLPAGAVSAGGYTQCSTAGQEGKNMDVFVSGQLLAADTGAAGANADRDYGETTTSGVTFRFDIPSGTNITYVIRQ